MTRVIVVTDFVCPSCVRNLKLSLILNLLCSRQDLFFYCHCCWIQHSSVDCLTLCAFAPISSCASPCSGLRPYSFCPPRRRLLLLFCSFETGGSWSFICKSSSAHCTGLKAFLRASALESFLHRLRTFKLSNRQSLIVSPLLFPKD